MRLFMFCLLLILTTISRISAQTVSYEKLINDIFDGISENLFGELWKFNQYCNDSRNSSIIEQDDLDAELFYNGTRINSLTNLNLLNQTLDDLNYRGIKARKSIAAICSINSWGYSDEREFELSNLPYDNETQCKLSIDDLYESSKILGGIYGTDFIGDEITKQNANESDHRFKQEVGPNIPNHWSQLNTFGRAPSGLLSSVFIWTGDYDNCAKLPSTRYCFAAYRSKNWPNETIDTSYAYKVGICLPRSCNSRSITSSGEYLDKIDQLTRFNLIKSHGIANRSLYKLIDIYCPPAYDSLFRSPFYDISSTILTIIAIIWFSLIIYATIEPLPKEAALLSYFDLKLSWKRFVKVGESSPQLEGLNALKNIIMFWLVLSHMYLLNLSSISNYVDLRSEISTSYIGAFILQGQHAVPPFFIISGILVGYKHLSSGDNGIESKKKFILYRYIRLLPMYLLVYAYVKKFGHLISSGPIWDYGVSEQSEARQCILESWFVPILMLANFIPPSSHCILTGWHIANDFQIYLLLPFLLNIYQKSRLRGMQLVLLSFFASHFYHIWNFYSTTRYTYRQFAHEPFIFGPTVILGRLAYDYVNPFGRFGTYFLGVALADLLLNSSNSNSDDTATKSNHNQQKEGHEEDNIRRRYEEDRGANKVLSSEKVSDDGISCKKEQQKSTLKLAACSSEKNVVVDENNNECQDNKLLVNLSTDHNNNNASNITTNNYQQSKQQQQTDQLSKAMQLVRRENKIPVCCIQPTAAARTTYSTDRQAKFKDIVLFFLGFVFITMCISVPLGSKGLKDILGPLNKSISYPLLRFLCEIGWAMIIYSVLAKRSNATSVSLKAKSKFEKKTSSVTTSFFLGTKKIQTDNVNVETVYNFTPGLGLTINFLRLPMWNILVKLNYTFILVHFTVIRYVLQSRRQLTPFSWYEYNQSMLFTALMTYLVSLFIYLTVETPLNLIINQLVSMFKRKGSVHSVERSGGL